MRGHWQAAARCDQPRDEEVIQESASREALRKMYHLFKNQYNSTKSH